MAFINEVVPKADQERAVFHNAFRWPGYSHRSTIPDMWTIDRDRDVYLVVTSTRWKDSDSMYYVMSWKGELIRIELAKTLGPKRSDNTHDLTWNLIELIVPNAFHAEREQIVATLKEALTAHGYLNQHKFIASVNFSF